MEMKIVPEISISVALEEIKKENETAVKTSESMEIDMPLVNLLPQLEDRLFDENKMGDPAFTELVDRIIDRLSPKGHLSKGHKMLLDSLHKLKEKSGAEDVDAAA
jgi:hypothetical protein